MRSIHIPRYGGPEVLQLQDVPIPQPKAGEVRVRVHAASLNAADWHLIRADPPFVRLVFGLTRPKKIKGPSADVAGVVDAVGPGVTRFKVGDAVFGDLFVSGMGAAADYVCAREAELVAKPAGLSFEEAASLPLAGGTAVKAVRDMGAVKAGQQVCIQGASGGVGIFALQVAKALGAEVTAVCSAGKAEQARALGADHVIDYAAEDFTARPERYDAIIACNGYHPLRRYRDCLKPGGRYVMVGGKGKQMAEAIFLGPFLGREGKTLRFLDTKPDRERVEYLAQLATEGRLRTVIDRVFSLEQCAEALAYVEAGHAAGKVVLKVA